MTQINTDVIVELNNSLAMELPEKISFEDVHYKLSAHINELIKNNFDNLVTLLYKIDVDEEKLKYHLLDHPNEDAGKVIASLIIERLSQKAIFRKQFINKPSSSDNEEKW